MAKRTIIANAFSVNMLSEASAWEIRCRPASLEEVRALVGATPVESVVGHAATAALFSELLGVDVPARRVELKIRPHEGALLIAGALGARLPEGRILSEDEIRAFSSSIKWWLVEIRPLPLG